MSLIKSVSQLLNCNRKLFRIASVLFISVLLLGIAIATLQTGVALAQPAGTTQFYIAPPAVITLTTNAIGDPLARIDCGAGYSATIYAENLTAPDGLAFSPAGDLYVAEESAGRVSQIGANGTITPVITGLSNPEGIAFDDSGNLYVVEDITGGRVVTRSTTGVTGTLTSGLDAPEGIVWVSDGNPSGTLYVTEQNLENALSMSNTTPSNYRTHVTAISLSGTKTRILTTTAQFSFPGGGLIEATFWSYSAITLGPDGNLYFANELSGQEITQTVSPFTIHAVSTDSIYTATTAVAPTTPISFADNTLIAPEGLRFSANGDFPLYVTEEDIGNGTGRLSQVQADGTISSFCTDFFAIEDVVVDQNGSLYVSEDTTGLIILIEASTTPTVTVNNVDITGPVSGSPGISYTFTATVSPNNSTEPVTYTWEATDQTMIVSQAFALSNTVNFSWSVTGTKTITVTAQNGGTSVSDTHTININDITNGGGNNVYLPIILKNN